MLKKTTILLIATMLFALLIAPAASNAAGGAEVALHLSRITACPGDSVTALGRADANEWVSVKVLDSAAGIVFYDAAKADAHGYYELAFKVPSGEMGTWTVVAGYDTEVATRNMSVAKTLPGTKNIASIDGQAAIEVPFGTARDKISFPSAVNVTLGDGSGASADVFWNNSTPGYDGSRAGEYTFTGALVNLQNITNAGNMPASVKVIVKAEETSPGSPGGPETPGTPGKPASPESPETPGTPGSPTSPSGSGGSAAGQTQTGGTEIKAAEGGRASGHDAVVTIPAGAFSRDLIIRIVQVADPGGLPLPEGGRLAGEVLEITKDERGDFARPVTITMKFDRSKAGSEAQLALCYYDPAAEAWIRLNNIKVDWEKGTVSGEIGHFTKFAVIAVASVEKLPVAPAPSLFSDIAGHWAEGNIGLLVASGAISGYPDGTFKPDNDITRAEFATVLVKALGLGQKTGKVFSDTAGHWAKDDIATAAAHGIVSGYSAASASFGPNDKITREQMAVMIVKAANPANSEQMLIPIFSDSAGISEWAGEAVAAAAKAGLLNGYPDGTFRPQGLATRAEAATVIIKAIE